MNRGEIWWASLPDPRGSEPGFRRPVLILQSNEFNRSRIQTLIIAAITSNVKLQAAPGNVFLSRSESGLPKDSVVNVSQIYTIDKSDLARCVGSIPPNILRSVDDGLKVILSLEG